MDISETLTPNSQQLDAIELIDGPRTFTVKKVDVNLKSEQPVHVHFEEFPRPWKPGINMRRVLGTGWGKDSSGWVGKRVTLYYDPEVRYGAGKPGGSRVSHMSHLDGPLNVPILLSQGNPGVWRVQPLSENAPIPSATETGNNPNTEIAELRAAWKDADDTEKARIESRVAELQAQA
jgi:hypothetical protein